MFFSFSERGGRIYSNTAETLLKCGFYQVFDSYEKSVAESSRANDVADLILYAEKGGRDITFSNEQWEVFLQKSSLSDAEKIFRYLMKKNIMLNYQVVAQFVVFQSSINPDFLSKSINCKKYFSLYYTSRRDDFFSMYNSGDIAIKRWIIDVLGSINEYDSVRFLIDRLTDVDRKISERAYESLRHVTKLDPAGAEHKEYHDIDVVEKFRDYAEKLRMG